MKPFDMDAEATVSYFIFEMEETTANFDLYIVSCKDDGSMEYASLISSKAGSFS